MEIDWISTGTVSSMIVVEYPRLPQGVGHTRLGNTMTDALTVVGEGFQPTPENRALTRDPFSFKVWLTGTEHTERDLTGIARLAAEFMSQVSNVLAEPSGLQRFLPTSGWRLELASSLVSPSL